MTQFNPASAAISRCCRNSCACFCLWRVIISGGRGSRFFTGQMVIIKARLAQRNHFGMFHHLAQRRADVIRRFLYIRGMPTNDGKHILKPFSQPDRASGCSREVGGDGNDLSDAHGLGALDDLREVGSVIR